MYNSGVGKTMENVRKQRHQPYNNRIQKKLFSVRTKLSQHKVFHRKFVSNRNEENSNIYE